MRYPLADYTNLRRTYRHGDKTFYSPKHLGVDIIVPVGTPIYAWSNCKVTSLVGNQGGNTAWVYSDGYIFRFLHLKSKPKAGNYKDGDIIAYSGNTGTSTAPHVHLDYWLEKTGVTIKFEDCFDPDKYFSKINQDEPMNKDFIKAIEKLTKDEYGDNLNENEQKEAAKKLIGVGEDIEELRRELTQVDMTLSQTITENIHLTALLEDAKKSIITSSNEIASLRNELEDTKKALENSSGAYKVLMDLKRALQALLGFGG